MANYYLVQNRPFIPTKRVSEESSSLQINCIESGICGMGWCADISLFRTDETVYLNNERNKDVYRDQYVEYIKEHEHIAKVSTKGLTTARNIYAEMREGDYVFTRLFDGSCYAGKVLGEAYHNNRRQEDVDERSGRNFSWIVDVEWIPLGEELNLPGSLRGLLSRRLNTADRVPKDETVSKFIIRELYERQGQRFALNEENFASAFSPEELEDLVGLYIINYERADGRLFHVVPSSCKPSTKKYEFKLVDDDNLVIVCQVKNREAIDVSFYESEDFYKVYLFSGIQYEGERSKDNTIIIDKKELFKFLKYEYRKMGYIYNVLGEYYTID